MMAEREWPEVLIDRGMSPIPGRGEMRVTNVADDYLWIGNENVCFATVTDLRQVRAIRAFCDAIIARRMKRRGKRRGKKR